MFERRAGQNRTSSDVATVARLVTQGAVDTLFVDIDGVVLGEVDEGRQTWPPLSWCQYGNSGARSGDRADLARIRGGTQ
ncbi:MAG TPA: hypothetical protein VJ140_02585 [Actinomycetota bacterium]|nr:hypothetical protein [Actinomycetota bacterium]